MKFRIEKKQIVKKNAPSSVFFSLEYESSLVVFVKSLGDYEQKWPFLVISGT